MQIDDAEAQKPELFHRSRGILVPENLQPLIADSGGGPRWILSDLTD